MRQESLSDQIQIVQHTRQASGICHAQQAGFLLGLWEPLGAEKRRRIGGRKGRGENGEQRAEEEAP